MMQDWVRDLHWDRLSCIIVPLSLDAVHALRESAVRVLLLLEDSASC